MDEDLLVEKAKKLVEEAHEEGLKLRILGAVAVRIHCPKFSIIHEKTNRRLTDLDLIGYSHQRKEIVNFMLKKRYEIDKDVADYIALSPRLIFERKEEKLKIDIFLDKLEMCHVIDFRKRLEIDFPTISLTDLLLEKLQIVKISRKDIIDIMTLLREHETGETDEREKINVKYISSILSRDWGFYYTVTQNLNKILSILPEYTELSPEDQDDLKRKIESILQFISNEPKSIKWRLRSIIGPRMKWYNEVEEIER